MSKEPFRGIFTIPSTPFRETGEIDADGLRRIVDFCVECGAHGLVYLVNASEFTDLSDEERFQLSEVLIEQNDGRIPAIVSGSPALPGRWRPSSPHEPEPSAQMVSPPCRRTFAGQI